MAILPVELIEEVVDEACRASTANTALQHANFLSTLAGVCAHFRHRVNRARFEAVSFSIRSSIHSRPAERLVQFEGLINADESVWVRNGDSAFSGNGIAQHIRSFAVDVMSGEGYMLGLLGDGVMARIMRRLFRPQREVTKHPCKFSLSCNVRLENGLALLEWSSLDQDFIEAFKCMCTTSDLSSLSLQGFRNFPTHIIRQSVIRQLHLESLSFKSTKGVESWASRLIQPEHLKDLTLDGVRFGIPDDNMILQLTSLTACLWAAKELHILHDILDGISKLEKLCILIGPDVMMGDLVAFDRDLPCLKELVIDLEPWMPFPRPIIKTLPTSFILGSHTPPTVRKIVVRFAIYMQNFSPHGEILEELRKHLTFLNLRILDQQLHISTFHTTVKHIQVQLSIKIPSYTNLDAAKTVEWQQKAREMVITSFPLLESSKKEIFTVEAAIDKRREAWRKLTRNYGV